MAYLKPHEMKSYEVQGTAHRDQYKLLSCSQGSLFGSIATVWSAINRFGSAGKKKKGSGAKRAKAHQDFFFNSNREI